MRASETVNIACLTAFFVLLAAAPAICDVVWPALDLAGGVAHWWVVAFGLVVEWPVAKYLTGRNWLKSWWPNIAMNLASTVLGFFALPLAGLVWEVFATFFIHSENVGTYNPATWVVTLLMAAAINTLVEAWILRLGFGVTRFSKSLLLLGAVNLVTVAAALYAIRDQVVGL